jgi:hypothetical protein
VSHVALSHVWPLSYVVPYAALFSYSDAVFTTPTIL